MAKIVFLNLTDNCFLKLKRAQIMTKSITKADLVWLTYNTEICNTCRTVDDCFTQDIVFQVYRPHHLDKLHQIFSDYKIVDTKDKKNNCYAKIKNFTINDLYYAIREYNGDMFLNISDNKVYFVPIDRVKYRRIFNRTPIRILINLPDSVKLNILKSLRQKCYMSAKGKEKSEDALYKKTNKLWALLQLHIPSQFMEDEMRKVRLIAGEIAQLPNIKENIEGFRHLPLKEQQNLLTKVCEITARHNHIDVPNIRFLTQKQTDADAGLEKWISAEAFSYEKNVCINKSFFKKDDGVQALSLAWHETTHVAQAYGDYSKYPLVEELFNQNLDFLQKMPQTYLFHPQEEVVYSLEKQFIEKVVEFTGVKTNDATFIYEPEYDIATQYIHRSMHLRG